MLETLGAHPNIVGVKLTCGGIAKVARVRSVFEPESFCALAGQSDWLLPAVSVGGTGAITGLANIYPRVRLLAPQKCVLANHIYRHVSTCTTCLSATNVKRPKGPKLILLLWSGGLQKVALMARSGWLHNIWDTPSQVAIRVAHIPNLRIRRSRSGLWI